MIRASDRDREQVVATLGVHASEGRLTLAEFEERATTAYAARHLAELDALLVDLPAGPRPRDADVVSARGGRRPRSFDVRARWGSWAFVGVTCLIIWALASLAQARPLYFWPVWVIGPWGFVLLRHTFGAGRSRSYRQSSEGAGRGR
jgi:uncharacterized protein DUF1707